MYSGWLDPITEHFDIVFYIRDVDEETIPQRIAQIEALIRKYDGYQLPRYYAKKRVMFNQIAERFPSYYAKGRVIYNQMAERFPEALIEIDLAVEMTGQAAHAVRKRISMLPGVLLVQAHVSGRGGGGGLAIFLLLPGEYLIPSSSKEDPPGY